MNPMMAPGRIWRRNKWFLIPLAIVVVLAVLFCWLLPANWQFGFGILALLGAGFALRFYWDRQIFLSLSERMGIEPVEKRLGRKLIWAGMGLIGLSIVWFAASLLILDFPPDPIGIDLVLGPSAVLFAIGGTFIFYALMFAPRR